MARGSSRSASEGRARPEGLADVKSKDGYLLRVGVAGWKDPEIQANANKDYIGSPEQAKAAMSYLAGTQKIVDGSASKGVDWKAGLPIGKYTSAQRAYEVDDSTIRGALNVVGIPGDSVKGIPADRLMRPWMLSSEYFDFSGKKAKQLKPIPDKEPGL